MCYTFGTFSIFPFQELSPFVEHFYNSFFKVTISTSVRFLAFTFVDCPFPYELRFFCFFICQVILDCILDILNIVLWNSGSCSDPVESVNNFILDAVDPVGFRLKVTTSLLWIVVPISLLFLMPLKYSLDPFHVCTIQRTSSLSSQKLRYVV